MFSCHPCLLFRIFFVNPPPTAYLPFHTGAALSWRRQRLDFLPTDLWQHLLCDVFYHAHTATLFCWFAYKRGDRRV